MHSVFVVWENRISLPPWVWQGGRILECIMHVVHSFQRRLDVSATIRLPSVGPKRIFVGFHLSLPGFFVVYAGLSMEQLLNSPSEFLLLNGGLQIMSALFQFIQTVGERHGDFSCAGTMYGAISSKFETLSGCPVQCFPLWLAKVCLSLSFCRPQQHSHPPHH